MAEPGDEGRRAAQIRAADDVRWAQVEVVKILLRRLVDDDATRDGFAAEIVDAVNAAGRDERAKRHAAGYLDEIGPEAPATLPYDAEDQWRAEVRDIRTNYRFLRPQHPGDEDLRDVQQIVQVWELDPNYAVEYSHRWVGPWMHANADGTLVEGDRRAADHLDQARAAGYRDAITALRNQPGFRAWRDKAGGPAFAAPVLAHCADYLEAVGPGQEDQKLTEEEQRGTGRVWVFSLDAQPDVLFADGTHRYWSTHCRHGRHEDCSATELTGEDVNAPEGGMVRIERTPAQCKTCAAPCICPCHEKSHG